MIKNVDMVFSNGSLNITLGPMEENIKEAGKMESNMEKVSFLISHLESGEKASGMMERELDGLLLRLQNNFLSF
jgi:hypothetical protein